MELRPLEQWVCDTCGQIIDGAQHGYVEWLHDEANRTSGYRIVHHLLASPLAERNPDEGCYAYGANPSRQDVALRDFVGPDGTAQQLSFLDPGYIDTRDNIPCIGSMKEYVEIMRRIAIPNYEEARRYWAQAEADGVFDGANEVSPYTQRTLTYILAEYRPENELDKL